MKKTEKGNGLIARAFKDTMPVLAGYIFLGFGFGLLMYQSGYGILFSVGMSLFIYAGSMQYAAVGLITGDSSFITVALTTLLVNARHIFYGISMIDTYKGMGKRKPYLIFSLTDETYSLVSSGNTPSELDKRDYFLAVSLFDHFYWVAGTALGALAGSVIPFSLDGIEFALTALFVTIFTEQWMSSKEHTPAAVGVLATVICLLVFGKDIFLIPSMLLIALFIFILGKMGGGSNVK